MSHIIQACFNKQLFGSYRKALVAGKRQGLTPYQCKLCPGWHLARS